jgi:hypothetical protein
MDECEAKAKEDDADAILATPSLGIQETRVKGDSYSMLFRKRIATRKQDAEPRKSDEDQASCVAHGGHASGLPTVVKQAAHSLIRQRAFEQENKELTCAVIGCRK